MIRVRARPDIPFNTTNARAHTQQNCFHFAVYVCTKNGFSPCHLISDSFGIKSFHWTSTTIDKQSVVITIYAGPSDILKAMSQLLANLQWFLIEISREKMD